MQENVFRKGLVFGISILFIGFGLIPNISSNIKTNNEIVSGYITKDRIENLYGLSYDDKGYCKINHQIESHTDCVKTFNIGYGEINPIWITKEDLGYFFSIKTHDDYIYAIGYKYYPVEGNYSAIIAKFNISDGKLLWIKTWEGFHTRTWAIDLEIYNNFIYIVGYTGPAGDIMWWMDSFLCKYDLDGNILWSKLINETKFDYIHGIELYDDYLYLCGNKNVISGYNAWILKYDFNGNKIWEKTYSILGTWFSEFLSLDINNGYIYAEGQTDSHDNSRQDVFVAKISLDGKPIWKREWGGSGPQLGAKIDAENESIYVCGYGHSSYSAYSPSYDILLKYDTDGKLLWKTDAHTNSILLDVKLYNGSIYTVGEIWRNSPYDCYGDVVLQKYDTYGNLIWYLTYGENNIIDYGRCIQIYIDSIFFCGISDFWDFIINYDINLFSDNNKPETPSKPSGPVKGTPNVIYDYSTSTTDLDDNHLSYCFSWGDENVTITTWVNSGELVTSSYSWSEKGIYKIRVRARDECGFVSDWSDPLSVTMPRSIGFRSLFMELLERFPNKFLFIRYLMSL